MADTRKKKILAVDNEPSIALALQYVFDQPRYDLTCVASGDAALTRLDENESDPGAGPFDAIIVDQKMPNLTGVQLVEAIRERGIQSNVIVVSARLSPEVREAYERMGVRAMFGKPFNVSEIRSMVDQLA